MKVKRFLAATALMASVAAFANQPKYVFLMIGDGMGPARLWPLKTICVWVRKRLRLR